MHSLLLNHVFVDGNKRTAIVSTIEFLILNGKKIKAANEEIVDFTLWVENKKPSIEQIAQRLEKHIIY